MVRTTCWACPYLDASLPAVGPPCGVTCPGSSKSWGTLPKSLLRTGVLPALPPYKSYRMSKGLIHTSLISSTSMTTASMPSSGFQSPPASRSLNLWSTSQGIWTLIPPPKVSHGPKTPPLCSYAPLPNPILSPGAYRRSLVPAIDCPPCDEHVTLGTLQEGVATLLQDHYRVPHGAGHKIYS